jgi:hypothetical protein
MDRERESVQTFFVTENNGENYKMTNNTNAWPSGKPYCPASPVTEATGLAPRSGKRTAN